MNKKLGSLIWVTGYFGAGKSTLTQGAVKKMPNLDFLKVITSRQARPSETGANKGEFEFVTRERYEELRSKSKLWDHSVVADNYYGTDVTEANRQLENGKNLICPVVPDSDILDGMRVLYIASPKLIWIDTPLELANDRILKLRPERIKHHLQTLNTRENILKQTDYIFKPTGDLEIDIGAFVNLIKEMIR